MAINVLMNPIACVLSFAMALRYSFSMLDEATRVEKAVEKVLADGVRTADLMRAQRAAFRSRQAKWATPSSLLWTQAFKPLDLLPRRDNLPARRALSLESGPMAVTPSPLHGAIYSIAAFSFFALNDITIKFLGSSYSPVQIVFFAGLASLPLIALQLLADKQEGSLRPVNPGWMALRMVIIGINSIVVSYSFAHLPLAQAYAIFFLMPLFICLLAALLLGEKIDTPAGMGGSGWVGRRSDRVATRLRPRPTPNCPSRQACSAPFWRITGPRRYRPERSAQPSTSFTRSWHRYRSPPSCCLVSICR